MSDQPQQPNAPAAQEQDPNANYEEEYLTQDDMLEEHQDEGDEPMDDEEEDDAGREDDDVELTEEQQQTLDELNAPDDSIQGFFSHHEPVYAISLHPTIPHLAATGGGDDNGYVWRLDNGEEVAKLTGHTDSVTSVRFSADGEYVATGAMDGNVRVWKKAGKEGENWEFLTALEVGDEITWIDWHPKGPVLLAGSADSTVWMWQLPSGNTMQVFSGHTDAVTCGRFTPDGKALVTCSADSSLILWSPRDSTPIHKLTGSDARFELDGGITALAVNPAGTVAVVGGAAGGLRVVNLQSGDVIGALDGHKEGESVEAVAFAPEGALGQGPAGVVATAATDGKVCVWDLTTMRLRNTVEHEDAVTTLRFHHASPLFTTGSADRTLKTWDARTGTLLRTLRGHSDTVLDLAVTADGKRIVGGGDDGVALVFSAE